MNVTPEEFMSGRANPMNGSSVWASSYADVLRQVVTTHARRAPRTLQRHLGPSELGTRCDRQVVGKMAGVPGHNKISDPWAAIVGTSVHAWLADAFTADNVRGGVTRWLAETQVHPLANHPGTVDLYDGVETAVVDHKVLSQASAAAIRSAEGPPRRYVVQLLLYALGFLRLGLPVKRVALAVWPRTGSSIHGLYVWDRELTSADYTLLEEVFTDTRRRTALAVEVAKGSRTLSDIAASPAASECYYCPYYHPGSVRTDECPGVV